MDAPHTRRRLVALSVVLALLIATPLAVVGADAFTDVPNSNVHHDDITWLKDNGVTAGCNPPANTEFCPGDPVLRQQMASFMRRLAENRVVDAATVEGHNAAQLMPVTESLAFDSVTNVSTDVTTAGEITIEVPTSGTVLAYGSGTFVIFGPNTVASLGVSTTATELGTSLSTGFLDGGGTGRHRHPVSPVGSFPVEAGSHTFYLNVQKSATFDSNEVNLGDPLLTILFVPGS